MKNQKLDFLTQAAIQEQIQEQQKQEQKLAQKENYFLINLQQHFESGRINYEIEKLVIEYQYLLILKYLQEAIKQVQQQLDQIAFQSQIENYPDELKCYLSTIKYLSSFVINCVYFPQFMEELNNQLKIQKSKDYTQFIAKRAYKLMKFQQLQCYYIDIFQKKTGIDLHININIQRNMNTYKNYDRIKFTFKNQKQNSQLKAIKQQQTSTSQINLYSTTPQPKIQGYHNQQEFVQSPITQDQSQNCFSIVPQQSHRELNSQASNIYVQQQSSILCNPQIYNQQSLIQQPGQYGNNSIVNYPVMPYSYNGQYNQALYQSMQQSQQKAYFQYQPYQMQDQSIIQQQQVQQYSYQQSFQQGQLLEYMKTQQNQNYLNQQQFNQYQQPNESQQMMQNIQPFQKDIVQQQLITDSIFQQSQSEISENQNVTLQQYSFDENITQDKLVLDDASFQEQINLKEDVQQQQILQKSEFEELIYNKSKITSLLLDPQSNEQIFSTKQVQFNGEKSNQRDLESMKLLERFIDKKQGQFEKEDQQKLIQQLFDF